MTSSSGYPFVTRREIQARLESEPAFMKECAAILQNRTEQRGAGSAPSGKAWGWMSSERVVAGRLTAKSKIGMLSVDDESKLTALVSRYSRQLADHFRSLALAENPGLSVAAVKFGVLPGGSDPSDISQGPPESKEMAERCHPSGEREPDVLEDDLDAELELGAEVIGTEPNVVNADGDPEPAQEEEELAPRVMRFVQRTPGRRTDAIADALSTTTAMLAPTLRMMVQGRKLRKQGVGRGTRYFVR